MSINLAILAFDRNVQDFYRHVWDFDRNARHFYQNVRDFERIDDISAEMFKNLTEILDFEQNI